LYLIYVSIKTSRRGIIDFQSDKKLTSGLKLGINGMLTSLSNPKAALMYMAIMQKYLGKNPSFFDAGLLMAIAILIVFLTYCGYSLAANTIRNFFVSRPRNQILFNYFSAASFFFIGSYFLFTAFRTLIT
jgi:threonine/homoserine/homoserine lactone efflux protein